MRPICLLSLLIVAAVMALAGCHKVSPDSQADSSRSLRVEAYDAPIPKAPLGGGKLETMTARPSDAPPAAASSVPSSGSSEPPAAAPAAQPQADASPRQRLWRAAALQDPQLRQNLEALDPSRAPTTAADQDGDNAAQPGFHITLPICRHAVELNDPLGDTPECRQMLAIAKDQARLCAKAFEDGNDKVVLSLACRQAARAR